MSDAKVQLGRRLFYDQRISINGKGSCSNRPSAARIYFFTGPPFGFPVTADSPSAEIPFGARIPNKWRNPSTMPIQFSGSLLLPSRQARNLRIHARSERCRQVSPSVLAQRRGSQATAARIRTRTRRIAVQMAAITGERNQINHGSPSVQMNRSSQSRLRPGLTRSRMDTWSSSLTACAQT
jgi:hypothetical protein